MKTLEALHVIQTRLNAPKGQENKFGGYKYRSLEDICGAVKPLLVETGAVFRMSDEIALVGDRIYVKATATIQGEDDPISAYGWAREPQSRKGMDEAQVTGATSSYARKYAANALFAIDDTKDADTMPPPDQKQKPVDTGNHERNYTALSSSLSLLDTIDAYNKFITDNKASFEKLLGKGEYLDMFRKDCVDKQKSFGVSA